MRMGVEAARLRDNASTLQEGTLTFPVVATLARSMGGTAGWTISAWISETHKGQWGS